MNNTQQAQCQYDRFSITTTSTIHPSSPLLPTPTKHPPIPFKWLLPEKITTRCEKGLCFKCDKKFTRDHKCSPELFLLIADDDEVPLDDLLDSMCPDPMETDEPIQAQISLHALLGHVALETLRLVVQVSNQRVLILSDGGSTHNFILECLIWMLGLTTQPTNPLRVTDDNDNELEYRQLYNNVAILIQGWAFFVDFHVLPLRGANLVLGVQWLKSLGPILMDYNDLTMKFLHADIVVELRGDRKNGFNAINTH